MAMTVPIINSSARHIAFHIVTASDEAKLTFSERLWDVVTRAYLVKDSREAKAELGQGRVKDAGCIYIN